MDMWADNRTAKCQKIATRLPDHSMGISCRECSSARLPMQENFYIA